jgi:hypothetical protein
VATEEKLMPDEPKLEPGAGSFAADFRDGEAMAREWIEGRGDLPGLLHIVRDMPRGSDMGGLEAGFLSTLDAVVRGDRRGEASAPDPAKAQILLEAPPPAGPPPLPAIDIDVFHLRQREHERKALLEGWARHNEEAFREQQAFIYGNRTPTDWRWW